MCRCKRSKTGRNFFSGDLCHVAVYLSVLPVDTVRAHHFAGVQATAVESDRLYALAGAKFQAALAFAPDDIEIISRYAQSIVNYLELESVQVRNDGRWTTGCERHVGFRGQHRNTISFYAHAWREARSLS